MKRLFLALWLFCPALAQEAQLRELGPPLSQAQAQATDLLAARFELMNAQAQALLRGQGDWEAFLRFYQATQQQVARAGALPPGLAQPWARIQGLMAEIGRQRGRALPPLGEFPAAVSAGGEPLRAALAALNSLETSLGAPPSGCDLARYQEARANLAELSRSLQRGDPAAARKARRRFYVTRSALQLPAANFSAVDQALDRLP